MTGEWTVERRSGPAGVLHQSSADLLDQPPVARMARILVAEEPAVVLGSHEPAEWFDPLALEASGLALARRRSGGGAVLVGAGLSLWVDFVVPAGDPLWDDDVSRASWWVGQVWKEAFALAGLEEAEALTVWRGPMRRTRWSSVVCFSGVGPGEVEIDGAKVVGIAQRRNRHGALFQSAVLLDWEPGLWMSLLSPAGRSAAGLDACEVGSNPSDLSGAGHPIGASREGLLIDALVGLLMT